MPARASPSSSQGNTRASPRMAIATRSTRGSSQRVWSTRGGEDASPPPCASIAVPFEAHSPRGVLRSTFSSAPKRRSPSCCAATLSIAATATPPPAPAAARTRSRYVFESANSLSSYSLAPASRSSASRDERFASRAASLQRMMAPAAASTTTIAGPAMAGAAMRAAHEVSTAIVASPLRGARLQCAPSRRLTATPQSAQTAANRSPIPIDGVVFQKLPHRKKRTPVRSYPCPQPKVVARGKSSQPPLNLGHNDRNGLATGSLQTASVLDRCSGLVVVALATTVAVAGCQSTAATTRQAPQQAPVGRPMYQMDAQHSGRSPYIGPRQPLLLRTFNTSVVPTPDPIFDSNDIQSSAAIAADGTAYIGLHNGTLFALRDPAGAGNQLAARWSFHPPGGSSWHATPAIGRDGSVYVGFSTDSTTPGAEGTLYALQAPSTGIEPTV